MAINNVNNKSAVDAKQVQTQQSQQQQQVQQQAQARTAAVATPVARQDAVSITPQAQQLNQLTRKAESESAVNQEKVEKVKKALANGSYQIDFENLAKKLAEFEQDLFGR